MNEILTNIITHPAFSIVAGVIGFLLGHCFSIYRDRRKEFSSAAEAFSDAFVSICQRLNKNEPIRDILIQEFPSQDAAKIKFARYLTGNNLGRFEDIWAKYQQNYDTSAKIGTAEMLYKDGEAMLKKVRDEVPTLIDKILLFAKPR